MPAERVLIVGGGVAGCIAAFWLAKYGFEVVVIERSKAEQKLGQGIEIEEPALKVVKAMGIMKQLVDKKTAELGFNLVDEHLRSYGILEAGGNSPTGDLELMRGDLTEVLYKAADASPNVTFRFETTLRSLTQTEDKVFAELEHKPTKATEVEEFDLMVGADGVRSRTRQLIISPSEEVSCHKPVGAFNAYFSIPKQDHDWPYSRLYHYENRRIIWTRPTAKDSNTTSVYLIHLNNNVESLRQANAANDRLKQKHAFAELFAGLGGEAPRIIEQMMKATNFYSDELVQIHLPKWSQQRVVLLGDSAWAPTPFTGQGNQLAIIGAWVLAQELSKNRSPIALEMYEKRLRPYVESCQKIPLNGYAPYLCCPETKWGIWIFRMFFYGLAVMVRLFLTLNLARFLPGKHQEDDFDLEIPEELKALVR